MSDLYDGKPYLRSVLNKLGYTEHTDPFNRENIPSNLLDKRYHLAQERAPVTQNNQDHITMRAPFTVSVHKKGFKNVNTKFQESLTDAEKIRDAMLAPQTRLTQPTIKNVTLESMDIVPLTGDNTHSMVLSFVFNMLILVSTRRAS